MYTQKQLEMIHLLSNGCTDIRELARLANVSVPQTYKIIRQLREMGFLPETGMILSKTPFVSSLTHMLNDVPDLTEPFSGKGLDILSAMDGPMTVPEICNATGLDLSRTYTKMRMLVARDLVLKNERNYTINHRLWPALSTLLSDYRRNCEIQISGVPIAATVYHHDKNDTVFSFQGSLEHTPTAFSMYGKYGINLLLGESFYCMKKAEPTLDEILIHSLYIISKNKSRRLRSYAIVFFLKYEQRLKIPDCPTMKIIKDILHGGIVEGWPTLSEIRERAENLGVDLNDRGCEIYR